jgi:hypothetical protein
MPYLIRDVGNLSFYIIETDRPSSNHQERHDRTDEEGDEFRRKRGERNQYQDPPTFPDADILQRICRAKVGLFRGFRFAFVLLCGRWPSTFLAVLPAGFRSRL